MEKRGMRNVVVGVIGTVVIIVGCGASVKRLNKAIEEGDRVEVERLIGEGVKVNVGKEVKQPLEGAIEGKEEGIANLLIEAGAEVNRECTNGKSPLQYAYGQELWSTVERLIRNGADVNVEIEYFNNYMNRWEKEPLSHLMVIDGKGELVKLVVDNGLDLNYQNEDGDTILHKIIFYEFPLDMIEYVVERGADLNIRNQKGRTPLSYAISEGRLDVAKMLIQHGADVFIRGYKDSDLYSVLANSWEDGYLELAEIFYQKGLPLDTEDFYALHAAAFDGNYEYTKWLLDHGADPKKQDSYGDYPIDMACRMSNDISAEGARIKSKIADLLLVYGSPPSADMVWP